ncbi:SepM family pheromone-processing serine protease [Halalkalibacillus halophilus]|uniref:SepM family pheromone-processing serine protease n=1 Tax=Halalkalibacillus halophilus TaxID=392827 RepID=UPI00042761DB|nr:SepM family pheromone-processing serine protease [Halalkalibacillus halophilus]
MLLKSKKQFIFFIVVIALAIFLSYYRMDYYIYQPGDTTSLSSVVDIDGSYESEGDLHLVTVRGGQATPIYYIWAQIRPHYDIVDLETVRPEGITQEEYMETQLHYMENSQEAATVVAFEAAGGDLTINYQGAYVALVVDDMPADGNLEMGDEILEVDDIPVESAEQIVEYTQELNVGDPIEVTVLRDDQEITVTFELEGFPDDPERPGMGISIVTDRDVEVNPEVRYDSGQIGGPSAGLMFALEVYNRLTEEDITKGLTIVGSGEIDYEGNIHRIGGVDKKVVSAERENASVFFAANEGGREGSNYEEAKRQAEEIDANLEVVPVDTFQDAIDYLEQLPEAN